MAQEFGLYIWRAVVLNLETTSSSGDIYQCLKTVLVVTVGCGDVLVSYCCHNKCPKLSGLEQHDLLPYSSGGWKSEMGLIGLKSRCW